MIKTWQANLDLSARCLKSPQRHLDKGQLVYIYKHQNCIIHSSAVKINSIPYRLYFQYCSSNMRRVRLYKTCFKDWLKPKISQFNPEIFLNWFSQGTETAFGCESLFWSSMFFPFPLARIKMKREFAKQ